MADYQPVAVDMNTLTPYTWVTDYVCGALLGIAREADPVEPRIPDGFELDSVCKISARHSPFGTSVASKQDTYSPGGRTF